MVVPLFFDGVIVVMSLFIYTKLHSMLFPIYFLADMYIVVVP